MSKTKLKKQANLKNPKHTNFNEIHFPSNSIILSKNDSYRHVYLLKSGEAGIFAENNPNKPLYIYKQGEYLNSIENCMSVSSFKTVKAINRCEVIFMTWSKERQDEERKNVFIPRIEELKFYEISLFKNLPYGLMLQLMMHFTKQSVSKTEITRFISQKTETTFFIITGSLTIQSLTNTSEFGRKRSQSCQIKKLRRSPLKQKSLRLLRFQAGQMLYGENLEHYRYNSESQKCEIIYIRNELLFQLLPTQCMQNVKQLKVVQRQNLMNRQSTTCKAFKTISRSFSQVNPHKQNVPERYLNVIERKCQKFQKALSLHYAKNNKDFCSYSDEKRKLLEGRDKRYKEIFQLNKTKYSKNYICEKRRQFFRDTHAGTGEILRKPIYLNGSKSVLICERAFNESVSAKDDYGNIRQSQFMKFIRRSRSQLRKNCASLDNSPVKVQKRDSHILNLSLKSVQKIRKNFKNNSKLTLKNYQAK